MAGSTGNVNANGISIRHEIFVEHSVVQAVVTSVEEHALVRAARGDGHAWWDFLAVRDNATVGLTEPLADRVCGLAEAGRDVDQS